MAKKFLGCVALVIVLVIIGAILLAAFSREASQLAFVPRGEFVEQQPLADNAYRDADMWYSRPGIGTGDPARWQPGYRDERLSIPRPADESAKGFAVFFVHPTSYTPLAIGQDAKWNAPMGDAEAERVARIYLRGMASPFGEAREIWAPKYRQASVGAFLTDSPDGQKAIDAAYVDVKRAFAYFLESLDEETPVVLAGHSQGSLHLLRLLREEVKGTSIYPRLAAVYAVGWPISLDHDLPEMGISPCNTETSFGCIISWSSFAEPAEPDDLLDAYGTSTGFDGTLRGDSAMLCSNPLTGKTGGDATREKNIGTLVPSGDMSSGELVTQAVPARCDERGLLLIGDPPEMGRFVLPGNNYHVYDIPLFWANTKADVARRVEAWWEAR